MIGYDLMRFFRRKPKEPEEVKVLCRDLRLFWWGIADNVDRTTPGGIR